MQTVRGLASLRGRSGFTLVELLVVITITALVGIVVFANFKNFTQDQVLNKAVGQIQTYLRLAQANATAGVLCNNQGGVPWSVKFDGNKLKLSLTCGTLESEQKVQTLEGAEVVSIQCSPVPNASCPPDGSTFPPPLTVNFTALNGNVGFAGGDSCITSASTLMIVLRNQKNDAKACFTISQGGAIDVQ